MSRGAEGRQAEAGRLERTSGVRRSERVQVNSLCAVVRVKENEALKEEKRNSISGDNGKRVPPVPIPNTEVKPLSADGTWLETARESRTPPDSNEGVSRKTDAFFFSGYRRFEGGRGRETRTTCLACSFQISE